MKIWGSVNFTVDYPTIHWSHRPARSKCFREDVYVECYAAKINQLKKNYKVSHLKQGKYKKLKVHVIQRQNYRSMENHM